MAVRNATYVFLGIVLGVSLAIVLNTTHALTTTERDSVVDAQDYALKFTGSYQPIYDDPYYKVFTYEKICKGFYVVEDNGTTVRLTGFGDLKDDYTYTYTHPVVENIINPTSTPPKNEIPVDIVIPNP